MLPTGLPTQYRRRRLTDDQRLANLLSIYGVPHSFKWTYTYLDYYRTKSFFSLVNLIKLSTNYASAYCSSALAITMGRATDKEQADIKMIFPEVNVQRLVSNHSTGEDDVLPELADLGIYFNLSEFKKLERITEWFGYEPFEYPGLYMREPLRLVLWLDEPYQSYFSDLTPEVFISKHLRRHTSLSNSLELDRLLKRIFSDDRAE